MRIRIATVTCRIRIQILLQPERTLNDRVHVFRDIRIISEHPQFARARNRLTADFDVEEAFHAPAASNMGQRKF